MVAGGSNAYVDYHRNDVLLSLQHLCSDRRDEMALILMTQCQELTLKAIHYELHHVRRRVKADDVIGAVALLPRVNQLIEYLLKTWEVLPTLSHPGVSDRLGHCSAQPSSMSLHVEFILGNKSTRLAQAHANNPQVHPQLRLALTSPSLYDEVLALLRRRGVDVPAQALRRDWSEAYQPNPAVAQAWRAVYSVPDPANDLYRLGEAMIELADLFTRYRWRRFTWWQRLVGVKPESGRAERFGSPKRVMEPRIFPELWSIWAGFETDR